MRSFAESDSHSLRHNLHFPNMSSDVFLYHVLHFHYRTSGWEFIFFLLHTCSALWTGCFCLSSVRRLLAIPFKSFFLLKSFPLEVPSAHFSGNSYCFYFFFSNWILPSNFVENTQNIRLNFCFTDTLVRMILSTWNPWNHCGDGGGEFLPFGGFFLKPQVSGSY